MSPPGGDKSPTTLYFSIQLHVGSLPTDVRGEALEMEWLTGLFANRSTASYSW